MSPAEHRLRVGRGIAGGRRVSPKGAGSAGATPPHPLSPDGDGQDSGISGPDVALASATPGSWMRGHTTASKLPVRLAMRVAAAWREMRRLMKLRAREDRYVDP